MYSPVLAVRVRDLKETPEEAGNECREMKKIREDGLEEGLELGREATREENALRMRKNHMSYELAAEYTGLSLDRGSTLAGEMFS